MGLKDNDYLDIAAIQARGSHCVSLKVGVVVVNEGRIITTGINGTPSGYPNCDEVFTGRSEEHSAWSNNHEIHAEKNAINFAAKHGLSVNGATLYTTVEPCWPCLKDLIQAGIKRVVYSEGYYREAIDSASKFEYARKCGVQVEKYSASSPATSSSGSTTPCGHLVSVRVSMTGAGGGSSGSPTSESPSPTILDFPVSVPCLQRPSQTGSES